MGRTGAGIVAIALVLAGCTSNTAHKPTTSSTTSSPTLTIPSSISLTPLPITPLPSSPVPSDAPTRLATDALLSADQLSGFQEIPWSDTPIPQPCSASGAKPVLTQVAPKTHVGRQFTLSTQAAILTEEVDVFSAPTAAKHAADLTKGGLDCTSGNFYGTDGSAQPVTVRGPADLMSIVGAGAQSASAWTMQNGDLTATLLVVLIDQVLVTLSFIAPSKADLKSLPDGRSIAQLALTNVRNSRLPQP